MSVSANFSGSPTSGLSDLTVRFKDLSTGSPTSWLWDFGDGTTSTLQHPSHTYTEAGLKIVSLTVSDGSTTDIKTVKGYIHVQINVSFEATPSKGGNPLTVQFTDTSKGSPNEWNWDFGDGSISTAQNPTHEYTLGRYSASLVAKRNFT